MTTALRPVLLTTREAAHQLGITVSSLTRWWREGRIQEAVPPGVNTPRMYDQETVRRLMDESPPPPSPVLDPRPWQPAAACKGMDTDRFFDSYAGQWDQLRAICDRCPVRAACLEFALSIERGLASETVYGLYGGLTANERVAIIAAERAAGGVPVVPVEDVKVCTGPCGREKPLTQFSLDRSTPDGRKQRCKTCMAEQQRLRERAEAAA